MTTDQKPNPTQSGHWPGGMNNVKNPHEVWDTELRDAQNVDISTTGHVRRRKGFQRLFTGNWHSLYDQSSWPYFFAVNDGALVALRLQPSETGYVLGAPVTITAVDPNLPMYFAEHIGRLYFSNGPDFGWIDSELGLHTWGVQPPTSTFSATTVAGALPAGAYQVALTYLGYDGEESAPTDSVLAASASDLNIVLTSIPTPPPSIQAIRVYMSPQNGNELYWVRDLAPTATSVVLSSQSQTGKMLETRNTARVQPGVMLRSHAGRLYWKNGARVEYTLPFQPGLYSPMASYYWFDSEVTGIERVESGLFIGTAAKVFYVDGNEPGQANLKIVKIPGMVQGTSRVVPGAAFGPQGGAAPVCVFWATDGGFCRGEPGGNVTNLTDGKLALPQYTEGATLYRELDGIKQVVSTMARGGTQSGFAARDVATAEVRRNGILVY